MFSNATAEEQIFWAIVMLEEIDMVNALVTSERSSQNSLHDQSVFHLAPYNSVRIAMCNVNISIAVRSIAISASEGEPEFVRTLRDC